MGTRDPRVDAYIANAAEFAHPILTTLRDAVHAACPDVEETIKWGHPTFMHKGILCGIAGFKQHCAMHFWKSGSIFAGEQARSAYGHLGRLESLDDVPARKVLIGYIKKAAELNASGIKPPAPRAKAKRAALTVPEEFLAAMKKNKRALSTFDGFSPSHQREYVEWITEAKRDETRARRIAQAVEWLAEGKPRNWKYMSS